MFDCVLPTREGRHGVAYTSRGKIRIKNQIHKESLEPLDPDCSCPACGSFTKSYLRHMFVAGEALGPMSLSIHNLTYYFKLMKEIREAIRENRFDALLKKIQDLYLDPEPKK